MIQAQRQGALDLDVSLLLVRARYQSASILRCSGLLTVLLEPLNGTFWVGCIYGRNDDASRFAYFCGAAAEYLRVANIQCAAAFTYLALRT